MKLLRQITCILFALIGAACVLFPGRITAALPYVLGGAMAAAGGAYTIAYFRSARIDYFQKGREAHPQRAEALTSGLVLLAVGPVCMLHGGEAIGPLGTTWALIGLRKAAKSLAKLLEGSGGGAAAAALLAEFLVRLALSLLLLIDPMGKFETHVMILGLELIAVSVRLTKGLALDAEE